MPELQSEAARFAEMIDRREYPFRLTKTEVELARAAGLVVMYGQSDDLVEMEGVINDEFGAYDSTTLRMTQAGPLPDWESFDNSDIDECRKYFVRDALPKRDIFAEWAPKDEPALSWRFRTDIPHATFNVMEDGEVFCRGIVFALKDVAA